MQTGLFFGHHIGLNVGDRWLTDEPLQPGMVFTVEPWYYDHARELAESDPTETDREQVRAIFGQMLIDAYAPLGLTQIAVDSIFMMPHLGVLSTIHERAASEVFNKDCLIPLGTCIAPHGVGNHGEACFSYTLQLPDGATQEEELAYGSLRLIPLAADRRAYIELIPSRKFDFGAGRGKTLTGTVSGGEVGLLLDARGRPLSLSTDKAVRMQQIQEWNNAVDMYPKEMAEG
ncbi:MAG: M24 family metallopeptidase [Myxococcales bacterium]|nr:M24 family metallopeptidase [Myxococcales bacterium]